jgi:four helix bundle protein
MKYKRFEDTPVWKAAIDAGVRAFLLVDDPAFRGRGDLRDQMQRAAASISNNIAEGFEKGTTQELITYLFHARGSAGEVRSMTWLLDALPWFNNLKSEISDLRSVCESISRQLQGWADSLQNSEIKGIRYLTDADRAEADRKARAAAFVKKLHEVTRGRPGNAEGTDADWSGVNGGPAS